MNKTLQIIDSITFEGGDKKSITVKIERDKQSIEDIQKAIDNAGVDVQVISREKE